MFKGISFLLAGRGGGAFVYLFPFLFIFKAAVLIAKLTTKTFFMQKKKILKKILMLILNFFHLFYHF